MIEGLAGLVGMLDDGLRTAALVFFRIGAVMATLPLFGEQAISVRVRLALAVAFTLVVSPAVLPQIGPLPEDVLPWLRLALPEVITGLLFGLALRLFVLALQIAGTIAAQSTSLSQIFGGSAGADPQPAMGHVLTVSGLALLAILGFHVKAAEYLILSYQIVPAGELPGASVVAEVGVREVGHAFALAFVLSAPFLVASLIYNVTLGVINRAMPQLMVAFVGAPAITAGGLILLLLSAPIALSVWADAVGLFLDNPFRRSGPMSMTDSDDKQFEPTQKKLDDARRKGEIARSTDLITAASYGGLLLVAVSIGGDAAMGLAESFAGMLARANDLASAGPPAMGVLLSAVWEATLPWFLGPDTPCAARHPRTARPRFRAVKARTQTVAHLPHRNRETEIRTRGLVRVLQELPEALHLLCRPWHLPRRADATSHANHQPRAGNGRRGIGPAHYWPSLP